jgi:hypothetical protein
MSNETEKTKRVGEGVQDEPESRLSRYGVGLVVAGIGVALALAAYFWNRYDWILNDAQMVGDASAPIAGAFTVGALVAALIALRLQTEELRLQRRELKASVQALNAQAAEARAANVQNEKALEFEREKAKKADERAEEAQRLQREMSEAALAESRNANLRSTYATWLGHLDQFHARIQTFAHERINQTMNLKSKGVPALWDELIRDIEETESRAFIHVRLVDSRELGLARAQQLRKYCGDRMGNPTDIFNGSGDQRGRLKEFASWLAAAIDEKPPATSTSTPADSRQGLETAVGIPLPTSVKSDAP